jgi:hypothetical protein
VSITVRVGQMHMQVMQLPDALGYIDNFAATASADDCSEAPIAVLSAGWRSGSTLVQRLIISSGEALIWGEPFGTASIFRQMIQPLKRIPRELNEDRLTSHYGNDHVQLSRSQIANLYPPTDRILRAHRSFWNTLIAEPAREAGFKRWGLKEVRFDAEQIAYWKWLYPKSQLVFLIRNPYDAFLSYRRVNALWFETWPEQPIQTAEQFGQHWNKLATYYANSAANWGALLIRFEDLHQRGLVALSEFLGLRFDDSVANERLNPWAKEQFIEPAQEEWERLRGAVSPTAARLGYTGPSK